MRNSIQYWLRSVLIYNSWNSRRFWHVQLQFWLQVLGWLKDYSHQPAVSSELGAVLSPGQPVRQLCNLLSDPRIQDLQIPREIPADAICKLRCAIVDGPGY